MKKVINYSELKAILIENKALKADNFKKHETLKSAVLELSNLKAVANDLKLQNEKLEDKYSKGKETINALLEKNENLKDLLNVAKEDMKNLKLQLIAESFKNIELDKKLLHLESNDKQFVENIKINNEYKNKDLSTELFNQTAEKTKQCPICFATFIDLQNHATICYNFKENIYICPACQEVKSSISSLKDHVLKCYSSAV